jgi:hypothetical protein
VGTTHWFAGDRPPVPAARDLWQLVRIDTLSGMLATEFTPPDVVDQRVFKVYPPEYRAWAESHGIPQPPTEASSVFAFEPRSTIRWPSSGASVSGLVTVTGTADVPLLDRYALRVRPAVAGSSYGASVASAYGVTVRQGVLGVWDTRSVANGSYDLRLRVHDRLGHTHDDTVRVHVMNELPTSTVTATAWATATGTSTATPWATRTVAASSTPVARLTPPPTSTASVPTPDPTSEPTATALPEPSPTPTSIAPTATPLASPTADGGAGATDPPPVQSTPGT